MFRLVVSSTVVPRQLTLHLSYWGLLEPIPVGALVPASVRAAARDAALDELVRCVTTALRVAMQKASLPSCCASGMSARPNHESTPLNGAFLQASLGKDGHNGCSQTLQGLAVQTCREQLQLEAIVMRALERQVSVLEAQEMAFRRVLAALGDVLAEFPVDSVGGRIGYASCRPSRRAIPQLESGDGVHGGLSSKCSAGVSAVKRFDPGDGVPRTKDALCRMHPELRTDAEIESYWAQCTPVFEGDQLPQELEAEVNRASEDTAMLLEYLQRRMPYLRIGAASIHVDSVESATHVPGHGWESVD